MGLDRSILMDTYNEKWVYKLVYQIGYLSDWMFSAPAIYLSAKRGVINTAWSLYHKMFLRGTEAWNLVINKWLSQHVGDQAQELFDENPVSVMRNLNGDVCFSVCVCYTCFVFDRGKRVEGSRSVGFARNMKEAYVPVANFSSQVFQFLHSAGDFRGIRDCSLMVILTNVIRCFRILRMSIFLHRRPPAHVIYEAVTILGRVEMVFKMLLWVGYLRWKFRLVPPGSWSIRSVSLAVHFSVFRFDENGTCQSILFCRAEDHNQFASTLMIVQCWHLVAGDTVRHIEMMKHDNLSMEEFLSSAHILVIAPGKIASLTEQCATHLSGVLLIIHDTRLNTYTIFDDKRGWTWDRRRSSIFEVLRSCCSGTITMIIIDSDTSISAYQDVNCEDSGHIYLVKTNSRELKSLFDVEMGTQAMGDTSSCADNRFACILENDTRVSCSMALIIIHWRQLVVGPGLQCVRVSQGYSLALGLLGFSYQFEGLIRLQTTIVACNFCIPPEGVAGDEYLSLKPVFVILILEDKDVFKESGMSCTRYCIGVPISYSRGVVSR